MTEGQAKRVRQARGEAMAVMRPAFVDEVADHQEAWRGTARTASEKRWIEARLADWMDRSLLGSRLREEGLQTFLVMGRLMSQAEVGSANPERPPDLEREIWTIDTTDPADLPVYGYAASEADVRGLGGNGTRRSLAATYGPARLIFKPSLAGRSTLTVGDSLDRLSRRVAAPSPVGGPSHLSWPRDFELRKDIDDGAADEFVEIQVLGRVFREDIARVIFDAQPAGETAQVLDYWGIPGSVS